MITPDARFALRPIGVLSTPFRTLGDCPRNGRQPDPPPLCRARLFAEFAPGLKDLEGFSHLITLYWLDRVADARLVVTPAFDDTRRGVFATRAPARPNPIGLAVTAFEGFEDPLCLRLRYLDCVDGTPLIDLKPYLPSTDSEPGAATGWLAPHTRPCSLR